MMDVAYNGFRDISNQWALRRPIGGSVWRQRMCSSLMEGSRQEKQLRTRFASPLYSRLTPFLMHWLPALLTRLTLRRLSKCCKTSQWGSLEYKSLTSSLIHSPTKSKVSVNQFSWTITSGLCRIRLVIKP